jgi:SAM-dependent methyltransferase
VAFVHSNCLLATSGNDALTTVKNFYSAAVGDKKTDILNPVCYNPEYLDHIPPRYRFRGYGCGSPVLDAGIQPGDHVVDLGCGSGVECFIAARLCGETGRVTGVDMLDPMLALAVEARTEVERNLGYSVISFKKGYLESLPLEDGTVDTVLSNCVMNLSVNKHEAYREIFRVLKPGGRLVISDVVCESEPPPSIRNDETLKGECIAGALTETRLMAVLERSGFTAVDILKRFPYRTVQGHPFYSMTYRAVKPMATEPVKVMYRGPLSHITSTSGSLLPRGSVVELDRHEAEMLGDQVFILDSSGTVTNIEAENACGCCAPPESAQSSAPSCDCGLPPESVEKTTPVIPLKHRSGCMVCGSPLNYDTVGHPSDCHYCGVGHPSANSLCEKGHFVCDTCHAKDALAVIRHICLTTRATDMIALLEKIRSHPAVPVHGPEHHAMVPGIILAVYRNLGGAVTEDRKSTRLNSSHNSESRMPSSA